MILRTSIRRKLHLQTVLCVLSLLVAVLSVYGLYRRTEQGLKDEARLQSVSRAVFELNALTGEYLLHPEARIVRQWRVRQASLAVLLAQFEHRSGAGPPHPDVLEAEAAELRAHFDRLVANTKREAPAGIKPAGAAYPEFLAGQLLTRMQVMVSEVAHLSEQNQADVSKGFRRHSFGLLFLLAAASIGLTAHSFALGRSIVRSLSRLINGTRIVAEGKLDHRLRMEERDEVGELAGDFDRMTERLEREAAARQAAAAALRASEERFRTAVGTMLDGFAIAVVERNESGVISDFRVEYVNEAGCRITAMPSEEQVGKRVSELFPGIVRMGFPKMFREVAETGRPFVSEGRYYEGVIGGHESPRAFDIRVTKLGDGIAMVFRDVTDRKNTESELERYRHHLEELVEERAAELRRTVERLGREIEERRRVEDELRESEERFRGAMMNAPIPQMLYAEDGQVLAVNEAWTDITGYAIGEIPTIVDWVAKAYGEKADEVLEEIRRHDRTPGRVHHGDRVFATRSGEKRSLDIHSSPVGKLPDGRRMILRTSIDVTERKRLEEQLRNAQRLESVGRLAGGVAHEFNNLMTVVTGYSEMLLGQIIRFPDIPRRESLRHEVEQIRKSGERAARLTGQLLAFGRRQMLQPRRMDLNDTVRHMGGMLSRLLGERIRLECRPSGEPAPVLADPAQVEQVILNLAFNARDAMPGGGRLTMETRNVELDETYRRQHPEVPAGPYVLLTVTDTGTGMDAETASHIFEPFFTTKEFGKGYGMGLAMVHGIVDQSGGHIFVYSEPGHGTSFKIYLPREKGVPAAQEEAMPEEEPAGKGEILVVEDEDTVRELVREILEETGYRVAEAADGKEALRLVLDRPAGERRVDLLLTDVVMPEMNGQELADRMRQHLPGVAVLFMSGYTENVVVRQGLLKPGVPFLQKPFSRAELLRTVRRLLAGPEERRKAG